MTFGKEQCGKCKSRTTRQGYPECVGAVEEWRVVGKRGIDGVVTVRSVTFTWKALNREVSGCDLHFNRTTLAAELGRGYWGQGQKKGEE